MASNTFPIYCMDCGEEIAKTENEELAKSTRDSLRCLECNEKAPIAEEEEEEEEDEGTPEEEEKEN